MKEGRLEKLFELEGVVTDEIHIVEQPCVPKAKFIIIKNKEGDDNMLGSGQGVGNPKMGVGGTDYCYCDTCKVRVKHTRNTPCGDEKCPICDKAMTGVKNKDIDYKEANKKMADELETTIEEELLKAGSLADALKILESAMETEKDAKKLQRLKLIVGNLKGMTKAGKKEEEEDEEKKKKMTKELVESLTDDIKTDLKEEIREEMAEEIEKAGRSVSKATAAAIAEVTNSLKAAIKALDSISKKGTSGKKKEEEEEEEEKKKGKKKDDEDYEYEYPKYPKKKVKKELDLTELQDTVMKSFDLYKNEQMDEDSVEKLVKGLLGLVMEDEIEEED